MKKYLSVLLCAAFLLTTALSVPVPAEEAPEESGTGLSQDLVILYTSDVHCGIDQHFGYAGLKAVKDTLENAGNHVLLVDDGDSIQGEPVGTMSRGESIIDLMNAMEYDVAIPGNHEFDYGVDRFLELTEKAEYPYICCNFVKEGERVFDAYLIREVDDMKIGFVGVTTPVTLTTSTPRYFQDEEGNFIYGFLQDETGEAVYQAVQEAVDAARADGADYVVLMGHLGNEAECEPWTYADVLTHTTGIDVMFDGHSHDTDQVVVKNRDGMDVPRCACGTKLNGIGYAKISAEDGSLSTGLYSWNNDISAPELLGITNDMTEVVNAELDELGTELEMVITKTTFPLVINDPEKTAEDGSPIRIVRRAETNLGDLCADAMRDQGQADIGFMNGGGVRVDVNAGEVTLNNILKVQPFGNMLTVVEATGQQILDALEWTSRVVPEENGGFLQCSGLTYEIHTYIESSATSDENGMFTGVTGEYRVKNVMVGGEPLDLEKTYTVACNDYVLLSNGDGMTAFDGCKVLQDRVKIDNQVLIDYITEDLGGVIGEEYEDLTGAGRIVIVDEAP